MIKKSEIKKGISIIEILIVVAIITIALTGLLGITTLSLKISTLTKETTRANNLAQEAIEATRNIRDSDWDKITNGNHGLTNTGGYWDFQGTEDISNGFTRTILIESVSRNPVNTNIEPTYNPANDDPNTRKATVTVSWKDKEVKIVTYFTNWK